MWPFDKLWSREPVKRRIRGPVPPPGMIWRTKQQRFVFCDEGVAARSLWQIELMATLSNKKSRVAKVIQAGTRAARKGHLLAASEKYLRANQLLGRKWDEKRGEWSRAGRMPVSEPKMSQRDTDTPRELWLG